MARHKLTARISLASLALTAFLLLAIPVTAHAALWASGIRADETVHVSDKVKLRWDGYDELLSEAVLQLARENDPGFTNPLIQDLTDIEDDNGVISLKLIDSPGTWFWRICDYSIWGYDCSPGVRFLVAEFTECEDSVDNDGDGRTDERDMACTSGRATRELLTRIPTLRTKDAKAYAKEAVSKSPKLGYQASYAKRWKCKRTKRLVAICRGSWIAGDTYYSAKVKIFYKWCGKNDYCWHYAYRGKIRNGYCEATGGTNCTRTFKKS